MSAAVCYKIGARGDGRRSAAEGSGEVGTLITAAFGADYIAAATASASAAASSQLVGMDAVCSSVAQLFTLCDSLR